MTHWTENNLFLLRLGEALVVQVTARRIFDIHEPATQSERKLSLQPCLRLLTYTTVQHLRKYRPFDTTVHFRFSRMKNNVPNGKILPGVPRQHTACRSQAITHFPNSWTVGDPRYQERTQVYRFWKKYLSCWIKSASIVGLKHSAPCVQSLVL